MPEGTNHSETKTRRNFIFIILKKQRFSFPNVYFGELFVWELKPSEILDCEANTFRLSSDSGWEEGERLWLSSGDNECHLRQDQRSQTGSQAARTLAGNTQLHSTGIII